MRHRRRSIGLIVCSLLLASCALPGQVSEASIATSVAATQRAQVPPTVTSTPEPPPLADTGRVSGRVCYPSEGIPPMTAYFQVEGLETAVPLAIGENQGTFQIELTPGTYLAYAWLPGYSLGGSYSAAVQCGLSVECTDHRPLAFSVRAGETTAGIDICDWYGGELSVPLPPGVVLGTPTTAPTVTPSVPTATGTEPGGISGSLSYPGSIPQIVVVAFHLDTPYWWWVGTASGQAWYAFSDIPPGRYQVVAYAPDGRQAAYANGGTVTVQPGQTTSGIDLGDWRPAGTYRAKPGGINYP
jgi:hypothetical protein